MRDFFKSFRYAFRGIAIAFGERNFIIQVIIGAAVVILSFVLGIALIEKLVVVMCVAMVLGAEIANSALERVLDFVSPSHHDDIAKIKDLAAGAVLLVSVMAVVIGVAIFGKVFLGM